ncbi:SGNH/GDSL hydrolase family protein [Candidatus Clostridium radicumherbarum]|uniref:SGNH/GDSL hydrolase family protein n=1 Tax=Candidatus Clostridium radicumherbarum TaxID=3381662 RepID=A0ABW8TTM4_9CLOT
MKQVVNHSAFMLTIIVILVLSLIFVVGIGQKKQNKLTMELTSLQKDISKNNPPAVNSNENNTEAASKPVSTAVLSNSTYKGVKALGNFDNDRWKNKKWYTIGDGMSAANNYQLKVKAMTGMDMVINDAAANRVMKDLTSNISAEKLKDMDLITVLAGTNDFAYNTPLGTIEDNDTQATFYGNVKKVINDILKAKPDANIVFITPLKRGTFMNEPVYPNPNKAGYKMEDYVQGIKAVCSTYNILVLDAFNKSGITENNLKQYTIDNLSLNEKGYQKLSQVISDYIKTIK